MKKKLEFDSNQFSREQIFSGKKHDTSMKIEDKIGLNRTDDISCRLGNLFLAEMNLMEQKICDIFNLKSQLKALMAKMAELERLCDKESSAVQQTRSHIH